MLTPAELLSLERAAFLLVPCAAAAALLLTVPPKPREAVAAMVGFLWQLPALLLLHILAVRLGWWTLTAPRNAVLGLPIDVWIGWAVWWGPVGVLLSRRVPIVALVVGSMLIDIATMPWLAPLVALGPHWLVGDAAAMALCLAPGLWVARLTRDDRAPKRRAMFHVLGWGGYMALVIPICVLAYEGRPASDLYHQPVGPLAWGLALTALLLLFVGIAATAEFARVGEGTPIPFDPPKRVVVSGPYAVTANPMQIISAAFMAVLALYARSWGLALVATMFALFDAIYATWYNRAHIALAMPAPWSAYRGQVNEWRLRWRPHVVGTAQVIISPDGFSRAIWERAWPFVSRRLQGEILVGSAPRQTFRRLVYRRAEAGIEDVGIKAAARILEHGPAPLALLAWALRFPYLGGALQLASGLVIVAWRRCVGIR